MKKYWFHQADPDVLTRLINKKAKKGYRVHTFQFTNDKGDWASVLMVRRKKK